MKGRGKYVVLWICPVETYTHSFNVDIVESHHLQGYQLDLMNKTHLRNVIRITLSSLVYYGLKLTVHNKFICQ